MDPITSTSHLPSMINNYRQVTGFESPVHTVTATVGIDLPGALESSTPLNRSRVLVNKTKVLTHSKRKSGKSFLMNSH